MGPPTGSWTTTDPPGSRSRPPSEEGRGIDDRGGPVDRDVQGPGPGSGGEDDVPPVERGLVQVGRGHLGVEGDGDGEPSALRLEPAGQVGQALPARAHRRRSRAHRRPVRCARPPPPGAHARRGPGRTRVRRARLRPPGRPGSLGRSLVGWLVGLVAAAGLAHAAHDGVAVVADVTGLVAQDAWPDPVWRARPDQRHQAGVGDLCPGHLDQVGRPAVQRRLARRQGRPCCLGGPRGRGRSPRGASGHRARG